MMIGRRIVFSLCLSSSIVLFSGPESHAGGSVTDGSLPYNPFEGEEVLSPAIVNAKKELIEAYAFRSAVEEQNIENLTKAIIVVYAVDVAWNIYTLGSGVVGATIAQQISLHTKSIIDITASVIDILYESHVFDK